MGGLIVLASILILSLPLTFAFGPLLAKLIGVSTVTLSADEAAIRFIALSGIGGGAGLVAGMWLMVRNRAPSKAAAPTHTPARVD